MKIEPIKTQPAFQPVEVKFIFESQAELDFLANLFNYNPLCAIAREYLNQSLSDDDFCVQMRSGLRIAGADMGYATFANLVKIGDKRMK